MTKLYKKSEISFAILWIVAYVVLSSLADQLSESIGIVKSITAALHIAMSLVLFIWIRKNGLGGTYGFCHSKTPAKRFLYYLPLVIIASASLLNGIGFRLGAAGTACYVISMCCVGFLEEVIFRGLLFRAMEKDNLKAAILVSALTFGLGHIVNLVNGSGKDLVSTLIQIVFAVLVGFVLVLIFYHGKSLIPCILFHSANNALKVFSAEGTFSPQTEMVINLALIVVVLGGYVLYLMKTFPIRPDSRR
jgi:membrane protease YdiL (CAAX protease family)